MRTLLLYIGSFLIAFGSFGQVLDLENDAYSISYNNSTKEINLSNKEDGASAIFKPSFYILINGSPANPALLDVSEDINFSTTSWGGDRDLFSAGSARVRTALDASVVDEAIHFTFTENAEFSLEATLEVPVGDEMPVLSYKFTAKTSAHFSIGYVGSPKYDEAELDEIWQPLVWTEKRFPEGAYLTPAFHCSLPSTMATYQGTTYGVIVDPDVYPFDPLPTFDRSQFGVALRNHEGLAQPMVWAPIMGKGTSAFDVDDQYSFRIRLFTTDKTIPNTYKSLANGLYGFGNYNRTNVLGSLNKTLDNMINYGMSEWSRFSEEFKGPSYEQDIPGAAKVSSSLNPLNIAFVTDSEDIFWDRAMPMIEFMLSRENRTFALEESSGAGQTAYNGLGDAIIPPSEMTALYSISKKNMPFLIELVEDDLGTIGGNVLEREWRFYLALYKATGDENYLSLAVSLGSQYINDRIDALQEGFTYLHHSKSSFWVSLSPKFVDLMETFDATGDDRYLQAAYHAAKKYAMYTWMAPLVPDVDITVNEGNQAPVYSYAGGSPISVPEEDVPAWRLANRGLNAEAAGTANGHRAIFNAHHAPYFLRIGHLMEDEYLKRIGKSGIIGRYRNFPAYHTNTDHSTVYEKANFPLRSFEEISSSSIHYNHVWPMMSLVLDYMISDVMVRSDQAIHFDHEFMEGHAYLQSRLFGHDAGSFYHVDSAMLWMPQELLDVSNDELNYISARKGDSLLIAFTNQSPHAVSATVTVNTSIVGFDGSHDLEVISDNGSMVNASTSGNVFTVSVSGDGITAVVIKDVEINPSLQNKFHAEPDTTWVNDYLDDEFASIQAMHLNFGPELSTIYIFSGKPKDTYANVSLFYIDANGDTLEINDVGYPFEFDLVWGGDEFEFYVETTDESGNAETSKWFRLEEELSTTAEMQGEDYILKGESTIIPVKLGGIGPWSLEYTDGEKVFSVEDIEEDTYGLLVSPDITTTYDLISVVDSRKQGGVSGSITVHVLEESITTNFDGMLRQRQGDGQFGTALIELKKSSAFERHGVFGFDISGLSVQNDLAVFRLYLENADKDFQLGAGLFGISSAFDESLTWDNQLGGEFLTEAGEAQFSQDDIGTYVEWKITDYLNQLMDEERQDVTFWVKVEEGNDALINAVAIENGTFTAQILYTSTQKENEEEETVLSSDNSTDKVLIYPNPSRNQFRVMTDGQFSSYQLKDLHGRTVLNGAIIGNDFLVKPNGVAEGIYVLRLWGPSYTVDRKVLIRY